MTQIIKRKGRYLRFYGLYTSKKYAYNKGRQLRLKYGYKKHYAVIPLNTKYYALYCT